MNHLTKSRPLNFLHIIVVGFILSGVVWFAFMLFFPATGGSGADVTPKKQVPTVVVAPKPKVVVPPPVQPILTPDYTLPLTVNGFAPVVTTLQTKQNIVFLGIDDGAFKDPSVVDMIQKNHIKASLFLSKAFIASNPDFFKQLVALGSVVEDHTLSHDTNMIKTQTYSEQK